LFTAGQTIRNQELASLLRLDSDEFRVLHVIRGGMGAVAKLEGIDGEAFALKFLELSDEGLSTFERFRREVQIWTSAASCSVVVDVRGLLRINEVTVVCAEWMPGGDLTRLMASQEPMIFYSALDRIIAGLDWVYQEYKIIHRDIKPANILLDVDSKPFISDWGIGRISFGSDDAPNDMVSVKTKLTEREATLTQTGRMLGTVPYCSPEQILNARSVDFRADIYSIGCLMYEWETGVLPFSGSRWEEVARGHLESPVPRIAGIFSRSKFGAEAVIYRCLEKKPENRYRTYSELRNALRHMALKRKVHVPESEIVRRRSVALIGQNQLLKEKPIVMGTKGYGLFEFEKIKVYLEEAEVLSAAGEWQKAYDTYEKFWSPILASTWFGEYLVTNIGNCLTRLGRASEAVIILNSIPESGVTQAEYFVNLGYAMLHQRRFVEAEKVTERGLKKFNDDVDLLGNLTLALKLQGRDEEALVVALKRLKRERDVHSLEETGAVLSSIGEKLVTVDFPKAVENLVQSAEIFGESIRLNPLYYNAKNNLAISLFHLGLYGEAMDTASRLPNERFWVQRRISLIAQCFNRLSMARECVEHCAKVKMQFPDDVHLLRAEAETIVDFYFVGKDTKEGKRVVVPECVDFFRHIVRDVEKRQVSDFGYLSQIEEWLGRPDLALKILEEAQSLYGERWEIYFGYSSLNFRLARLEEAYENSIKACELAPWHRPVWRQRSFLEKKLGLADSVLSERRSEELSEKIKELRESALNLLRTKKVIL
jgi:serine/threonine protein kinase